MQAVIRQKRQRTTVEDRDFDFNVSQMTEARSTGDLASHFASLLYLSIYNALYIAVRTWSRCAA